MKSLLSSTNLVPQVIGWQIALLALPAGLLAWLGARQSWGISPAWWGLATGTWPVMVWGWQSLWQRHQAAGTTAKATGGGDAAAVNSAFAQLDGHILDSLNKISNLSAEATGSMVERLGAFQVQSDQLVSYLSASGEQSDRIKTVIDQNTKIIEHLNHFIGDLEQKVLEERQHSQELLQEVQQFSEMTQVIRSIARQTDILAINARIEAARAGEAGHGFAVLAGEVRRLSMQSNESASKIDADITRMLKTVQERLGDSMEARLQNQENGSKSLLEMTQQLSDSYLDIRDFYQILISSVAESNIRLNNDSNVQLLLDLGQYQDVFKQIIDRVHTVFEQRQECLSDLVNGVDKVYDGIPNANATVQALAAVGAAYIESEANHGDAGVLVDKNTGATLERIELF